MSVPVQRYLKNRRDRALGTILGWSETNIFASLTQAQREAFRSKVLEALNSYHDSVLDLVKAEDGVRNDRAIELLEQLNGRVSDALLQTRVHSGV